MPDNLAAFLDAEALPWSNAVRVMIPPGVLRELNERGHGFAERNPPVAEWGLWEVLGAIMRDARFVLVMELSPVSARDRRPASTLAGG